MSRKKKNTAPHAAEIEVIKEAIHASERMLKAARVLLDTYEQGARQKSPETAEKPGITGIFEGASFVTSTGEKHPVPANYAAKTGLVYGDTVKMVPGEGDAKDMFKVIARVKRTRLSATLQRGGQGTWRAHAGDRQYAVLPEAVVHVGGEEGKLITVVVPEGRVDVPFAALEKDVPPKKEAPAVKAAPASPKQEKPKRSEQPKQKRREAPVTTSEQKRREAPKKTTAARKPPQKKPAQAAQRGTSAAGGEKKEAAPTRAPDDPGRVLEHDDLR